MEKLILLKMRRAARRRSGLGGGRLWLVLGVPSRGQEVGLSVEEERVRSYHDGGVFSFRR